jgi:tetratricopeptide (TPR) repeat protein
MGKSRPSAERHFNEPAHGFKEAMDFFQMPGRFEFIGPFLRLMTSIRVHLLEGSLPMPFFSRTPTLILAALLCAAPLRAHDSPVHVVEELTARIKQHGPTADLLLQRATEYRVLGKLSAAARDLQHAVKLQPGFTAAYAELARIHLAQNKTAAALNAINRAIQSVAPAAPPAALQMIHAEIRAARGEYSMALAACDIAFATPPTDPEWYLTRAVYLTRLGLTNDTVRVLRDGFEKTGSAVLEVEWIETLVDTRHFSEALRHIESHLRDTRWRSSWLLRRARARLGQGDAIAARADLRDSLDEINERLHPQRPDGSLLADRALAHALLGDARSAKKDLARARKMGVDASILRRVENCLTK